LDRRTASQVRPLEQGENLCGNVHLRGLHASPYTRGFNSSASHGAMTEIIREWMLGYGWGGS
jgi:hypothetical protein